MVEEVGQLKKLSIVRILRSAVREQRYGVVTRWWEWIKAISFF